jgi:hypothetical protein
MTTHAKEILRWGAIALCGGYGVWSLDCSFGVIGLIPLGLAHRWIVRLRGLEKLED